MLFDIQTKMAERIDTFQPERKQRVRPAFIGSDWYSEIVRMIAEFVNDHMLGVVIDERVAEQYPNLIEELYDKLPRVRSLKIKAGESAKTFDTFVEINKFLLDQELHRDDTLLSIGGGSISDVTGFVASTYTRGINWIDMPTTLTGQVDSSIGGKVAINIGVHKNYCGTFYWPSAVFIDTAFLGSLSKRHYSWVVPELAKFAMLSDASDFAKLCEDCNPLVGAMGIKDELISYYKSTIQAKSALIAADPYSHGLRKALRTGNTTAHALEAASKLNMHHGEAVSVALAFESFISVERGLLSADDRKLLVSLLENCGLPTTLPPELHDNMLVDHMRREKINRGRDISFILPYHPGKVTEDWPAPEVELSLDETWSALANYRQI